METSKMIELRNSIDNIDSLIIPLFAQRFKITEEIGIFKAENDIKAKDPNRESEQFKKIIQIAQSNGLNQDYATEIYRCVMDIVISRHKEIKHIKE